VSGTTPSDSLRADVARVARRASGWRLGVWLAPLVAALLFLALHLAFLAPTLDDIDAVNFAFGVRAFDPASHHPHPPGYPVYIVLGKLSTAVASVIRPPGPAAPLHRDAAALGLALWSALGGAVALLACYAVFRRLEALGAHAGEAVEPLGVETDQAGHRIALWAAVLAACAPLAWFSASRPMSDAPGLAGALVAQALLLEAWVRQERAAGALGGMPGAFRSGERPAVKHERGGSTSLRDPLVLGALLAGLALGIRSQVLWLTLPLLVAVVVVRSRTETQGTSVRDALLAAIPGPCAYVVGVAAWFVPMLLVTGWRRYLLALGGQGAEDFSGVDMLWTHFGPRRLAIGLWQTFVLPWSSAPLAFVVLLAACAGVIVLFRRGRAALAAVALLAVPYAIFHTLFHETITTRYALPLLPAICYLAVRGIAALGRRFTIAALSALAIASLAVGIPAIRAYAATPAPIFQALAETQVRAAAGRDEVVLGMHRRVATEARPALNWVQAATWSRRLPSPRGGEWNQALRLLREEPDRPVWFLGEPARRGELRVRDLSLVDPRALREAHAFGWNVTAAGLLSGVRPDAVDLYEVRAPGWVAGEGWALTPETAGLADKRKRGPLYGPIDALVRRRAGETVMLLGGRYLGGAAEGSARIAVCVDGRPVAEFVVEPQPQFFLRMLTVPAAALSGPGTFGSLTIAARSADGARPAHVAIEQFDVDDVNGLVMGYGDGWQEAEYDPSRQHMWRWASERATVRVHAGNPAVPLTLRLTAESPRKYFDRPSHVQIRVGPDVVWGATPDARLPRLLARLAGAGRFSADVPIDHAALARASGQITIETDQYFMPAERGQGADRRHLALRVLDVQVVAGRAAR
jgi:hypothetical protein